MKTYTFFIRGIVLLLLLTAATGAWAQDYASYYQGRKVYYQPSTTQLLVQFTNPAALARYAAVPATLGVQAVRPLPVLPGVALLDLAPGKSPAAIQLLVAQLNRDSDVAHAGPVLLNEVGKPFGGVADQFIVQLKSSASLADLQRLLTQTGAVLHHQYEFEAHTYYLAVDKSKGAACYKPAAATRLHRHLG